MDFLHNSFSELSEVTVFEVDLELQRDTHRDSEGLLELEKVEILC